MINEDILKRSSLSIKLYIFSLRFIFIVLGKLYQAAAEKLALKLFLHPPRPNASRWEIKFANKGKIEDVKFKDKKLRLLRHGNGEHTVVIIHGWGSRSTHLCTLAEAMITAGYTVISMDGPAHGDSTGTSTDMMEYAQAIAAVEHHVGKIDVVVGHSFGAACTLLAINNFDFNPGKIVLISCFSNAIFITEKFANFFWINQKTISGMRKLLERHYNFEWNWEAIAPELLIKNIEQEVLIIHDKTDPEVPFTHAEALQNSHGNADLFKTEGQGHRKILRNKSAAQAIVDFI